MKETGEKEIIAKINCLKTVLPNHCWKKATYKKITGNQGYFHFIGNDLSFFFSQQFKKPAFAMAMVVLLVVFGFLVGFWGNNNNKTTFNGQIIEEENAKYYLSIAEKDLDEISSVSTKDITVNRQKVEKVNNAIKMASQKLPKAIKNIQETAEIVEKVVNINKKAQSLMAVAADISIDTQDLNQKTTEIIENGIKETTEELIALLEKTSLNEEQKILFEEAKESFKSGLYQQTLEKILRMTNNIQ